MSPGFGSRGSAPVAPLWDSSNARMTAIEDRIIEIESQMAKFVDDRIVSVIQDRLFAIENTFPTMQKEFNDMASQIAEMKRNISALQSMPAVIGPQPMPGPSPLMGPQPLAGSGMPVPLMSLGHGPGPMPGPRGMQHGFVPPIHTKVEVSDEIEIAGVVARVLDMVDPHHGVLGFEFEGIKYKAVFDLNDFKNKDEIRDFAAPGEQFVIAAIGRDNLDGVEFEIVGMVPIHTYDPSRVEIAKPGFKRELQDTMGTVNVLDKDNAEITVFIRGLPKKLKVHREKFIIAGVVPDDLTGLKRDRIHCEVGKWRTKTGTEYFIVRAWVLGRKRDLDKDGEEGGNAAKKLCLEDEGWEKMGVYTTKYLPMNSSLCRARLTIGAGEAKDYFFTRGVAIYDGEQVVDFTGINEKKVEVTVEGRKDEKGAFKYRISSVTFPGRDTPSKKAVAGPLRFGSISAKKFRAISEKKGLATVVVAGKDLLLEVPEGVLMNNGNPVENYKEFTGKQGMRCEIVKNEAGVYKVKRAWFGKSKNPEKPKGAISKEQQIKVEKKTKQDKRFRESCIKKAVGQFVPADDKNGVIKFDDRELPVRPPLVWKDKTYLEKFEGIEPFEVAFYYAEIPVEPKQESVLLAWAGEEPDQAELNKVYKLNNKRVQEFAQFTKVTDEEGFFTVPELGELVVKKGRFFVAGDTVQDLKRIGKEKFLYEISVDEMGNPEREVPLAWVGAKPPSSDAREKILAEIQEYGYGSFLRCRILTGKHRNMTVLVRYTDNEGEPTVLESTNLFDILELELIYAPSHRECFTAMQFEKVASGKLKEVPDPMEEEPEEDVEMEKQEGEAETEKEGETEKEEKSQEEPTNGQVEGMED